VDFSDAHVARLNDNPLYRALGIRVERVADGAARAILEPTASACWPQPDQPHGGVLFTLLDTTTAWAAMSHGDEGDGCVTVDCSIQYPAPARHAPFACVAATTRRSGRTVFMRAEVLDAHGTPVALGQATFRLVKAKPAA
jgi:acyl-CoA thioesterase